MKRTQTLLTLSILLLIPLSATANYLGDIVSAQGYQCWPGNWTHVDVTFSYKIDSPEGGRIMVLPYTDGNETPAFVWPGSPLYAQGEGTSASWFSITSGERFVDQIQVSLWNEAFDELLMEIFVPVEYHFGPVGIHDVEFNYSQPSWIKYGEELQITHAWTSDVEGYMFARPFTDGNLTPGYGASGGEHVTPGTGTGDHFFLFDSGPKHVDEIRFQLLDTDLNTVLWECFVPVDYHWDAHGLMNFSFDPAPPQWLAYDENSTCQFEYATDDPNGVLIWVFGANDDQILWDDMYYQGSVIEPAPGGISDRYFRYVADTDLTQACIMMRNSDQSETYLTVFVPLKEHYRAHAVNNITLTPGKPAILDLAEPIYGSFDYYTTGNADLRIWIAGFAQGYNVTDAYGGSPLYPPPSGSDYNYFRVDGPAGTLVDQVRFRMRNADTDEIILEAFYPAMHIYGTSGVATGVEPVTPAGVAELLPCFPNPFNPKTTLRFVLPEQGWVRLSIHDVQGRLVKELANGGHLAGVHEFVWEGKDANDNRVASGVYLAKLSTETADQTQKLVLVK